MASLQQSALHATTDTSDVLQTDRYNIMRSAAVVLRSLQEPETLAVVDQTSIKRIVLVLEFASVGLLSQEVLMILKQPIHVLPDAHPQVSLSIRPMMILTRKPLATLRSPPEVALLGIIKSGIKEYRRCAKGLPLCTLDDVFRAFQQQARAQLPQTPAATQARNAAYSLCHEMPDHFDHEHLRSETFDQCLAPVFPVEGWRARVPIHPRTETHGGTVDRIYALNGTMYILREDQLEADTGDPYMQVVRDYQLYTEQMRSKNRALFAQGALVFLLSLLGPILMICGGFHDGKSAIVEPLAEPCLLFDDLLHNRQEVLARQLFALKEAVDALGNRSYEDNVKDLPVGVPRVYKAYKTKDKGDQRLEWLFRVPTNVPHSLLFLATEDPDCKDPACERLVKLIHKYGDQVHQLLEKHGFAPVLYG
ncbi:hypothetical protein FS837_012428 [Tulasnella sp. UAMH 9824]|nr:hypothetical protein FS837_012428 [Tulasnella sp. UAMH 9824]